MKTLHVFLAVAGVIAGEMLFLSVLYNGFFWDHAAEKVIGGVLLAGVLTYFWKRSGFRGPKMKVAYYPGR